MEKFMKKRGAMLIVYIPRELDHHFAQQITGALDQELEKGTVRQLVFDFSDTDFMDSSGIGVILGRLKELQRTGGSLTILNPSAQMKKILKMAGRGDLIHGLYNDIGGHAADTQHFFHRTASFQLHSIL